MNDRARNDMPEDIQEQLAQLDSRLREIGASASRTRRMTVLVLAVICLAQAGYLLVIYRSVRDAGRPAALVGRACEMLRTRGGGDAWVASLNAQAPRVVSGFESDLAALKDKLPEGRARAAALVERNVPWMMQQLGRRLEDIHDEFPDIRKETADRLRSQAPASLAELTPRLGELRASIPKQAQWLVGALTAKAPEIANVFRDEMVARTVPGLQAHLVERAAGTQATADAEYARKFDEIVDRVIAQHRDDISTLDDDALQEALQASFEEESRDVLEELARSAEQRVAQVKDALAGMIARAEAGAPLSPEERLQLRYVQLCKTYWNARTLGRP